MAYVQNGYELPYNPFIAEYGLYTQGGSQPAFIKQGDQWLQGVQRPSAGDMDFSPPQWDYVPYTGDPTSLTYTQSPMGDYGQDTQLPYEGRWNVNYNYNTFQQNDPTLYNDWTTYDGGGFLRDSMGYTNMKPIGYDPETGAYITMQKTGDKEGTLIRWDPTPNGGVKATVLGTQAWDSNKDFFDQSAWKILSKVLPVVGGYAADAAGLTTGGLEGMGTGAAPGEAAGSFTGSAISGAPTSLGDIWNIAKNVGSTVYDAAKTGVGVIGTANTISNLTGNGPLIGPGGSIINTGGGGGGPSGSTVGGGPVGNNTGGTGNGTTNGSGGFGDLLGLLFDVAGQAYSADRQESTADKLQAMYNDQAAKAAPWEQKLADSYTPQGIEAIMSSPEFMNERYSYKQGIDRKAAKAGTLTNAFSGIPGDPALARGREAALQRFGLEYLDKYRKPIQEQVGLYTKNAADYKLLAALGLGTEMNIPSQWANTLAKYRNANGGWNIDGVMRDITNAGGSIANWWRSVTSGSANPGSADGTGGGTPGGVSTGGDPAHDNPDWPGGGTGTGTGTVGPGWDFSGQDQGVIYAPDGTVWMPDPNTGEWMPAEVP